MGAACSASVAMGCPLCRGWAVGAVHGAARGVLAWGVSPAPKVNSTSEQCDECKEGACGSAVVVQLPVMGGCQVGAHFS